MPVPSVFRHLILAAVPIAIAAPAVAQGFENLERLEADLVAVLGAGVGQPGGPTAPLDRRMKLAACPTRPDFGPARAGAASIACPAAGWRIRVPLIGGGPAHQAGTGQAGAANAMAAPVAAELLVRRGDPVTISAGGAGYLVTRDGVAEGDGALGARVRVRIDPRKPPVTGEVAGPGEIRMATLK